MLVLGSAIENKNTNAGQLLSGCLRWPALPAAREQSHPALPSNHCVINTKPPKGIAALTP
jgi:hypothetical protein